MSLSYSLEIVPLEHTETGLRLRTDMCSAQSYDVVLREEVEGGQKFISRTPTESLEEAHALAEQTAGGLDGKVEMIGDFDLAADKELTGEGHPAPNV